ncbi:MAG: hypothetical protein ABWZ82_03210 [Candidatus Limnocylindrales bacterium]
MRPDMRRVAPLMLGVALATTILAAPVAAQDETFPPEESLPPPVCDILTADEVSAALGETLTLAYGESTWCQFEAAPERILGLYTSIAEGVTRQEMIEVLCSAPESPAPGASVAPCGLEVPVGTSTGSYISDSFGGRLFVDVENGDPLDLQLVGELAEGVDKLAAMTALGALALPRLGALPDPTAEPTEAAVEQDGELAALFPADVAGSALTVETRRGESALVDSEPGIREVMLAALAAQGASIEDLSIGYGFGDTAQIIALRVRGADIRPYVQDLLGAFISGPVPSMTPQGVAPGKDVSSITADGQQVFVYPKDDVLWLVVADGAALIESFAELP